MKGKVPSSKFQAPKNIQAPSSKELLVVCPLCRQAGFTPRGLRSHWCEKNGKKPLTKEAVQAVVDAAKARSELDQRITARAADASSRRRYRAQQLRKGDAV